MSKFFNHKTLSKEYYLSILKKLYPEIIINKVEKKHGYDSVVLIINRNRLFKIPQRREVINQYLLEEKIYPLIKKYCTLSVPEIIDMRKGKNNFDEFVVEYSIIKGNHLTLEIEKNIFSYTDLKIIGKQIGRYISEIHSLNLDIILDLGLSDFDKEKWHKEYDFVRKNCFYFWNNKQIKWVENLYENFLKIWDLKTFIPVFIHGDLGSWHVFSTQNNITGFIDWGDMRVDDPACDIMWHEKSEEHNKIIGRAVIKEYNKIHKLDSYFLERTNFYKKRSPISKFIKGVKFKDENRIKDGYILLENAMKI